MNKEFVLKITKNKHQNTTYPPAGGDLIACPAFFGEHL